MRFAAAIGIPRIYTKQTMPIDWDQFFKDEVKVEQEFWNDLMSDDGIIYTTGLGICIGVCIAFDNWAGIGHHSRAQDNTEAYDELISAAKQVIPPDRIASTHPILTGSDRTDSEYGDYEESRDWAIKKVKDAGFGEPILHWCGDHETAEITVSLTDKLIEITVGGESHDYAIPQSRG